MSRADGLKLDNLKRSTFGDYYDPSNLRVENKSLSQIVVAVNDGTGFQPIKLLLPHQLYTKTVEKILEQYPNHEIWVVPLYDSKLWTQVDLNAKTEWEKAQVGELWEIYYEKEWLSAIVLVREETEEPSFMINTNTWVERTDPRIQRANKVSTQNTHNTNTTDR